MACDDGLKPCVSWVLALNTVWSVAVFNKWVDDAQSTVENYPSPHILAMKYVTALALRGGDDERIATRHFVSVIQVARQENQLSINSLRRPFEIREHEFAYRCG